MLPKWVGHCNVKSCPVLLKNTFIMSILSYVFLSESQEVTMEAEVKSDEAEPLCESAEKVDSDSVSQTEEGTPTTQDSSIINGDGADGEQEMVDLKIIWNKIKYDLKIPLDSSGAKLKEAIHSLTGK